MIGMIKKMWVVRANIREHRPIADNPAVERQQYYKIYDFNDLFHCIM